MGRGFGWVGGCGWVKVGWEEGLGEWVWFGWVDVVG